MDIYVTSEQLVQGISNFVWGGKVYQVLEFYSTTLGNLISPSLVINCRADLAVSSNPPVR